MKNRNAVIYAGAWGTIIAVTAVDLLWARRAGIQISHGWPTSALGRFAAPILCAAALWWIASLDRYRRLTRAVRCSEFSVAILCLVTIGVWAETVSVASYLGVGLNVPTIADVLVRFDEAIGFHWPSAYHWVNAHRGLRIVLKYAYWSAFAQLLLVPFSLAVVRRQSDMAEFLAILLLSAIVLLAISIPFPAESAFLYYGITDPGTASTVRDFTLLRSAAMPAINPYAVQGLVSMPSYHTMLAIFFAYSVRHVRLVFLTLVVLNAVMIASTITVGGHYLADVLAGIVCGVAVIIGVRWALRRQSTQREDSGSRSSVSDAGGSSAPAP